LPNELPAREAGSAALFGAGNREGVSSDLVSDW